MSGFSKACLADEAAAQIAAKSIIEKGKKNVLALFGHPHLSITKLRYASFKNYFDLHAKDTKVTYYFTEQVEVSRQVCLEVFKESIPDAVFCMGDMILMGVMHAVHESKLNVPEDISIIGISNGLIPTLYDPKITYVETSGFKLGQLAFKQMFASLKGFNEIEEVMLESVLVEGGSL